MDPVLAGLARAGLALLFATAALHKTRDMSRFEAIVADYQLLPAGLPPWAFRGVTRGLVAAEAVVAIALLLPSFHSSSLSSSLFSFHAPPSDAIATTTALAAIAMLALYSSAIGVNLARGRREIECGCGGRDADRRLGPGLLLRNALLIAVAGFAALPVHARPLGVLDGFTLAAGLAALVLAWQAGDRIASLPTLNPIHRRRSTP